MSSRFSWLCAVLLLAGCTADEPAATNADKTGTPDTTLTVTSPDFVEGAPIPADFTCTGAGKAPRIAWTGDTKGAAALAVVVDDPDAPGGTYVHWIVLDLPAGTTSLRDGDKVTQGKNSSSGKGWTPPCPPSGTHHYRFTVYGLSRPTGLGDGAGRQEALDAISKNAVTSGRLTGLVTH
ncbi:YbhB/YbcL family Raf kinase inhibitor-like protein [Dactylosporangium sp. NPDC049140]|uniref:YbhB/YbcL family Raf kinase inhibitor-like protein n=1 Tax=Dactylosporangium sp. NPDC049140 TaxID=3155647 RepID=UPI0033F77553